MNELFIYKELHIHLKINPRLKHSYLRVIGGSDVEIKTSIASKKFVHKLIDERYEWILKQIGFLKEHEKPQIKLGTEILLFGKTIPLHLKEMSPLQEKIAKLKTKEKQKIAKLYDDFYKLQARVYITKRVEEFARIMQLIPTKISFRKMRRRWGSCNSKRELTFNTNLLKLPKELIDYVVVHELAHIKEMNHSKKFHTLVEKYLPNSKHLKKEIATWHLRE